MDDESLDAYDYDLPPDLVAQEPLHDRDASRLLRLDRSTGAISHHGFRDISSLLRPGDLLVTNDTRVLPARLVGRRARTGGKWEGLFLSTTNAGAGTASAWLVIARTGGRPQSGERVILLDRQGHDADSIELLERGAGGTWTVAPIGGPGSFEAAESLLSRVGRVPLPGYIRRGEACDLDTSRYQTIYATHAGSAAAPTAGLHFTEDVLRSLADRGVNRASLTLHVGLGTFRPIQSPSIREHSMHTEWCECPEDTVAAIHHTKAAGGRIVAVGTTCVRSLETASRTGTLAAWRGPTDLFIRPGHVFRSVDAILTNFHMPRTTLLVLVSAFASRANVLAAYAEAIERRYRLLSYGDCMLID